MRSPLTARVCMVDGCGYVAPWAPDGTTYYCPAHGTPLAPVRLIVAYDQLEEEE